MSQLNESFIGSIKNTFSSTRFSCNDFRFEFPAEGANLLVIIFKYVDYYYFTLSVAPTYGSSKFEIEYSPGEYRIKDEVGIDDIEKCKNLIRGWCLNINNEITYRSNPIEELEKLRSSVESQIENDIDDSESIFNNEELATLNERFEKLAEDFKKLEDEQKITEEQLKRVEEELNNIKSSAVVLPKKMWAKMTNNKLIDLAIYISKTPEGRKFIIDSIKKLLLPGS